MLTYDASIKEDDLGKRNEHCSANREKLESVGRLIGHQVRIKRNNDEYGLYTVSEVRLESPDDLFAWSCHGAPADSGSWGLVDS